MNQRIIYPTDDGHAAVIVPPPPALLNEVVNTVLIQEQSRLNVDNNPLTDFKNT